MHAKLEAVTALLARLDQLHLFEQQPPAQQQQQQQGQSDMVAAVNRALGVLAHTESQLGNAPLPQVSLPAGGAEPRGQGGLEGATNQTISALPNVQAEAERLLGLGQDTPLASGGQHPQHMGIPHMGGSGPVTSPLPLPFGRLDPKPDMTQAARAVLPERYGVRSNSLLGASASEMVLAISHDANGTAVLRPMATAGGRSTFLSDNELLRELPDYAAYHIAATQCGTVLFQQGRLDAATQLAYQAFLVEQSRLYTHNFNSPGHLFFLKWDRECRLQQHVRSLARGDVIRECTPILIRYTSDAAVLRAQTSYQVLRSGRTRGGRGQVREQQTGNSRFQVPRASMCFPFARDGRCDRGDASPWAATHHCLTCGSADHGTYQCRADRGPQPHAGQGQGALPRP